MQRALRRIRTAVAARPRVAAAAAVVAVAAVLGGFYLANTGGSARAAPADSVPANVSYVGHVDAEEARSSDATWNVTRQVTRFQGAVAFYDGPPFRRSYLFRESNLSADAVASVTYFGRANSSYDARVVRADWDRAALVSAVEADANVSLSRGEYRGRPVFAGGGLAVAALGDGTFAVGNESAVRDAVDVAAGERAPVSGPLRKRFEAREGHLRFAYRFRPASVPDYPFVGESIRKVEYVATGYRPNSSNVTTETVVVVEDREGARGVKGLLAFAKTIYSRTTGDEGLSRQLDRLSFAVERRTVVVRYTGSPADYRVLLRGLYRQQPEPA